jgi:hypothetical protein
MPAVHVIDDVVQSQTKTGKDIWKVKIDGKQWSTFDRDLAEKALALKGQKAEVLLEESVKGEFTNYNIKGVRPVANAPAKPSFTVEAGPQENIARSVALKAAVDFQGGKGNVADVLLVANEFLAWLAGSPAKEPMRSPGSSISGPIDDIPFAVTV